MAVYQAAPKQFPSQLVLSWRSSVTHLCGRTCTLVRGSMSVQQLERDTFPVGTLLEFFMHSPLRAGGHVSMYYSWKIGRQTVPQLYSIRTTYVLPLFDKYVLHTSAIRQVRTKKSICSATWHMQKGDGSNLLLGLRSGVKPWSRNQSAVQLL